MHPAKIPYSVLWTRILGQAAAHSTRTALVCHRGGDSSAEVPLAELYLKGDGVPKNCEQAAVLLRTASKHGNVKALEKLKKLGKNGCR